MEGYVLTKNWSTEADQPYKKHKEEKGKMEKVQGVICEK